MMFPPTMQAMKVSLRTDMRAYERLLKYVTVDTTSDGNSESVPTTKRQFDLARILVDELKQLGVNDARCDDMCYVYGSIPATKGFENKPQRCKECRSKRKNAAKPQREYFTVTCAQCGGEAKVPFQPTSDRPVLCSACFAASRNQ
jgi:CxxC-x17-CxxC domain-containing protein